jgi:hypothetical protein
MTFVLMNVFELGDVDLANPFIKYLFFYIPTALNVIHLFENMVQYKNIYVRLITTRDSFLEVVFMLQTLYLAFGTNLLFSFFPQLLADATYFPGTL